MSEHAERYRKARRRYAVAWAALMLLLAATATIGRLNLGIGNLLAGLGIAFIKCAIVVWVFMAFDRASTLVRLAFGAGLALLLVLEGLSLLDFAPRRDEPARWQTPHQIAPLGWLFRGYASPPRSAGLIFASPRTPAPSAKPTPVPPQFCCPRCREPDNLPVARSLPQRLG
jgi:caa(3)-type oxidase subunit IV